MNIKSITDVITNSSSEVFTIIHKDDVNKIKQVINIILKMGGSVWTCDDLFDIKVEWDEDYLREWFDDEDSNIEDLKERGWEKMNDYDEGYFPYPDINIIPKFSVDPHEKNLLQAFGVMFADHEERYC